jgi:DNA-binding transcriptional ArsR family regulator
MTEQVELDFSDPPFQQHSQTSKDAAEQIKVTAGTLRHQVLGAIRVHGPVTDEWLADVLMMNPSTVRPRRIELQRAGLIRSLDEKGKTRSGRAANRWVAVNG